MQIFPVRNKILFAIVLVILPAHAQENLIVSSRFSAIDQHFLKPMNKAGLGFVVKVFTKDKVLHQASYGTANLQTALPNSETTNFNLASNTKQFTAGLALILEQEGKLDTSAKVSKYLPRFPAQYADVTVDHLIHHTSGLPEYWELCDNKQKVKNQDIIDLLAKKKLETAPGTHYSYSNSGYVVLSEIIEQISGQTFPQFMAEKIFRPLGMYSSEVRDEQTENQIRRKAIGYAGAPSFEEDDESVCNYNYGDSSVYSSLEDYSKWLNALTSNQLFSSDSQTKLFAKSKTTAGAPVEYGYGWGINTYRQGVPVYGHEGSWQGFRTAAAYLPTKGIWFTALSNCSEFKEEEIVDAYLDAVLDSTKSVNAD